MSTGKPSVSVIVPAYNEADILTDNMQRICVCLRNLEDEYEWEVLIVNDGSSDQTADLAEDFARNIDQVRVLHHRHNYGLGQALQYGLNECQGDYAVVLDMDLSYEPEHIGTLLTSIRESGAKIVAASPYMKGGKLSSVPWHRRTLSIWANRFLSLASRGNLSTLTSMVRVYDTQFLDRVNIRATGMDINPELIYKGLLLRGDVKEIPAHLDWSQLDVGKTGRRSSMRILRQMLSVLLSGFLFRPVMFFIVPGVLILLFAIYPTVWMFVHFFHYFFGEFATLTWLPSRASQSVAAAFQLAPHTFVVAGMSWMLGIQLVSLGILALQSKSYFEEIYHLGSSILREERRSQR